LDNLGAPSVTVGSGKLARWMLDSLDMKTKTKTTWSDRVKDAEKHISKSDKAWIKDLVKNRGKGSTVTVCLVKL
jgi:hypothetical protein